MITRMFSERRTAISSRMLEKFSSVIIAPIDADDEGLFAKARDVLQDAPQIGWFHVWLAMGGNGYRSRKARC